MAEPIDQVGKIENKNSLVGNRNEKEGNTVVV